MKKKTMKVLSLVLAIVMVVSIIPLSVFAKETEPERKVGVVVYGAELTSLLTEAEDALSGDISIEDFVDKITTIATKAVDGTGISVPDVDVTVTDKYGKNYKLEEDTTIEIFTETTEMYIPFQDTVVDEIETIQTKLEELKTIMSKYDVLNMIDGMDTIGSELTDVLKNIQSLSTDLVAELAKLTGMNGTLYRTYTSSETLPVGDIIVTVEGFIDTDEDGNAITRDGYILYNDGLEPGSGFNTQRTFTTELKEQGMFDHEIQFVGPANGIQGKFELPDALNSVYSVAADALNTISATMQALLDKLNGKEESSGWIGTIINSATSIFTKITDTEELFAWLTDWNLPTLPTGDALDLSYKFVFPGLWCAESDAGFTFKDVDVAEAGITGSEFLMVNREEVIDILKFMKDLGKDAFKGALAATFGSEVTYSDGTVVDYEGITELYTQLVQSEDGQLSLDKDTAYAILKTYIGVISDMNLVDRVLVTDEGLLNTRLRYPIPAILKATSDEDGLVTFNKSNNITLTWMIQIMDEISDSITGLINTDNEVVNLLMTVYNYAEDLMVEGGDAVINTLVYPFAQRMGLVGKKFAAGYYIMFQYKAADGYWLNPMAYTMKVEWINESWIYVTLADLGIIMPYFAEGFYDFVRNTTVAGTIDKFLGKLTGKTDFDLISKILSDELDMTAELNQMVTAALTAFASQISFEALGGDKLFSSVTDLAADMNQYLYNQGRTAQNLMIYMNNMALKAKAVYAGDLTPVVNEKTGVTTYWQFYNLDKSPTATLNKAIEKTTENIAACFVSDKQKTVVTNTGAAVQKVVNAVSTAVETTVTKVTTKVTTAAKTAASKVVKSVASSIKTVASNLFSKIFSK